MTGFSRAVFAVAAAAGLAGAAWANPPAPVPAPPAAFQATETVEAVLIEGNDLIAADAWLAHLTVKPGDPVDREALRAEFRTLWDTGFADDMRLELRDGPRGGKLVVFVVHERPRVVTLEFLGSEELDEDDILEKLEEEDSVIGVGAPYDPDKVVRAREIIEEMLVDKGRTEGAVASEITEEDTGVKIVFNIDDEQQIRIRRIRFEGIEALDEWPLRWAMKKTRESHALGALLGGSTYTEEQYAEDIEAVRQEYLKQGYLDVSFGPPQFEYEDGYSRQFLFWKRQKRWMDVTIPVVEGEQYRVGEGHGRGGRGVSGRFRPGVLPAPGRRGLRRVEGQRRARIAPRALRRPRLRAVHRFPDLAPPSRGKDRGRGHQPRGRGSVPGEQASSSGGTPPPRTASSAARCG